MKKCIVILFMCLMAASNETLSIIGKKKQISLTGLSLFRDFGNVFKDEAHGKFSIPQVEATDTSGNSDTWSHAIYFKFKPFALTNIEAQIVLRTRELTNKLAKTEHLTEKLNADEDQIVIEVWARKKPLLDKPDNFTHALNIVLPAKFVGTMAPFIVTKEGGFNIELNKNKSKFLID